MIIEMERFESLIPRILPQVLPCPKALILDALQMVAIDFCKTSGAWHHVEQVEMLKDEQLIPIFLEKDTSISCVKKIHVDGILISNDAYTVNSHEITLHSAISRDCVVSVELELRPSRSAESIPASIIEEWGDYLVFGALAKIKSMSGVDIEWSDANGAAMNLGLYNEGCGVARVRVFRNRNGNGTLYANS